MAYPERGRGSRTQAPKISTGSIGGLPPASRLGTLQRSSGDLSRALPPGFTPLNVPRAPGAVQGGIAATLAAIGGGIAGDPGHIGYVLGTLQGRREAQQEALRANATMRNEAAIATARENYLRERERFRSTEARGAERRRSAEARGAEERGRRADIAAREDEQAHDLRMLERRAELAPAGGERDEATISRGLIGEAQENAEYWLEVLDLINTGGDGVLERPGGGWNITLPNGEVRVIPSLGFVEDQLAIHETAVRETSDPETLKKVQLMYSRLREKIGEQQKGTPSSSDIYTLALGPEAQGSAEGRDPASARITRQTQEAKLDRDLQIIQQQKSVRDALDGAVDSIVRVAEKIRAGETVPSSVPRHMLGDLGPELHKTLSMNTVLRRFQEEGVRAQAGGIDATVKMPKLPPDASPEDKARALEAFARAVVSEQLRVQDAINGILAKYPSGAHSRLLGETERDR